MFFSLLSVPGAFQYTLLCSMAFWFLIRSHLPLNKKKGKKEGKKSIWVDLSSCFNQKHLFHSLTSKISWEKMVYEAFIYNKFNHSWFLMLKRDHILIAWFLLVILEILGNTLLTR